MDSRLKAGNDSKLMRPGMWIIVVLALVLLLALQFPYALQNSDDKFHLFYMTLLLLFVGSGALAVRRVNMSQTIKYSLIWLGIILALVLGYSQRHIFLDNALFAELLPHRVRVSADGTLSVKAAEDGHFHIEGEVNGALVRFMVDTGASDIVLSPRDARRAGYDVETLNYTRVYHTANGTGSGAPVRIGRLEIGPIVLENVEASVNEADMEQSLLGMGFLKELKGYSVEGDTLMLRP